MTRVSCLLLVLFSGMILTSQRTAAQEAAAAPPAAQEAAQDAVQVELVDAGKAPRRQLRFTPNVGDKQTAVMTMKMGITTSVNGQETPAADLPAQKFTIEVTIVDVSAEGDITYEFNYLDAALVDDPAKPSPIAATLESAIKPLIGMTGRAVVTNRGLSRSTTINIPENLDPMIKGTLESMKDTMNRASSPVPAEAVGVGGSWKVTQKIAANGLEMTQTSTHTLTKLDENEFAMDVEIKQSAEPQEVKAPGLPPGAKLMLTSLDSSGKGQTSSLASSIFPKKSEINLESNAKMNVAVSGFKQAVDTKTTVFMTIE